MIDFSADVYGVAATRPSPAEPQRAAVPAPATATSATDLLDAPRDWTWQQLRDYVLRAIADRHGPQPPADPAREASVFKSFHTRWGAQAGPIARFAFEQQDGYWNSAPIGVTRFCKASDHYFAQPIAQRLFA
ncbi:hypothetical protein ABZS76_33350 [Streptomyces sp. NPDC005562]|uniref:hypothetical protein n=1 Tax=Streptomyces sp. NPDC005562 TaxID=3154890 RepID=UPI0033B29737